MTGNRVEELETQVKELKATVSGLTDELVETKERLRLIEDHFGPELDDIIEGTSTRSDARSSMNRARQGSQQAQQAQQQGSQEQVEEAVAGAEESADEAKTTEEEADDESAGTDDIIVA